MHLSDCFDQDNHNYNARECVDERFKSTMFKSIVEEWERERRIEKDPKFRESEHNAQQASAAQLKKFEDEGLLPPVILTDK